MFMKAQQIEPGITLNTGVCIIGGGAAGIAVACELAGQAFDVTILESGDFEFDEQIQSLYRGESLGLPYDVYATRLRFFGGTTNHWGGSCLPLVENDFLLRAWLPHSGWPLRLEELMPYYLRAQETCQLGPFDYAQQIKEKRKQYTVRSDRLDPIAFKANPLRFGQAYRQELENAPRIRAVIYASVLEIETNEGATEVTRLKVRSSGVEGNEFFVRATIYILAAGGIENARLLLLSNTKAPAGLGNHSDQVGRFFQEHVDYYQAALVVLEPPPDGRDPDHMGLSFTPAEREKHGLLAAQIQMHRAKVPELEWYERLWGRMSRAVQGNEEQPISLRYWAERGVEPFNVGIDSEQAPNPESRVRLGTEKDRFGQNRVAMEWHLTDLDRQSLMKTLELFGRELGRLNRGRLWIRQTTSENWPPKTISWGSHHIGTTRMSADPEQGVVDANCRIHGVHNLFVAGSSVFPSSGLANPTLTLVALAIRLADHVKNAMLEGQT